MLWLKASYGKRWFSRDTVLSRTTVRWLTVWLEHARIKDGWVLRRLLHTFSATDPTTGSNSEGANPDYGVLFDEENDRLIGMADYGGLGSVAGAIGNGTLYQLQLQ